MVPRRLRWPPMSERSPARVEAALSRDVASLVLACVMLLIDFLLLAYCAKSIAVVG